MTSLRNRDLSTDQVLLACPIQLCVGEILALESSLQAAMATGKLLERSIPEGVTRKFEDLSVKLQAAAQAALAISAAARKPPSA